jgi:K+/H+ antiporter YhaU regulatory subunit KhtT
MPDTLIIKPVYQQIAIDLASRISNGEFKVGDKILGRSTLAGHYNVSPETIRRAVILLQDMNIVESYQGSGIIVNSRENAYKFTEKFKNIDTISTIKNTISDLINKKGKLDEELTSNFNKLLDYSERFININPFSPYEIKITEDCKYLDKTIGEIDLWQNTGATIIGIKRDNKIILSPGPYAILTIDDIFIYIGEESAYDRIFDYLYKD